MRADEARGTGHAAGRSERIAGPLQPRAGLGKSATFTCPFRSVLGGSANDDLDVALRSEIYFRSEYDLPVVGSLPLADNRGPFILNTRLLPPRWTAKPDR